VVYTVFQFGPSFHSGYGLSAALNPLGIGVNSLGQICAVALGLVVQYRLTGPHDAVASAVHNDIARGGVREQHKQDPIYSFIGAFFVVIGLYLQKSSVLMFQALAILVLVKAFVTSLK
jgi:hypothetical protein